MKTLNLNEGMGSVNVESQVDISRILKLAGLANSATSAGTAYSGIVESEGEPSGEEHLTSELAQHILDQIETEGTHAIVKSIEWGDGAADELIEMIKNGLKNVIGDAQETNNENS